MEIGGSDIISHGLREAGHGSGQHSKGLLVGDQTSAVSVHHDLFAHNHARVPELKGDTETEVHNNVSYNWGKNNLCLAYTHDYEDEPLLANIIGNYSISGVDTSSGCAERSIYIGPVDHFGATVYVQGNIGPNRTSDSQPENDAVCESGSPTVEYVNSQDEVRGFPTLAPGSPPVDTDQDGMPDAWETARGLDPSSDDSAADRDGDGYTNIEEYINGLIPNPSGPAGPAGPLAAPTLLD